MPTIHMTTRYFALVVGIAFTLAGIAGFIPFFTPPPPIWAPPLTLNSNYGLLIGLFPVNAVHSVFHFCVGVYGMAAFRTYPSARQFSRFLGVTFAVLTVMGLIPTFHIHTTFGLLPLYGHDIWLHGLEAIIGLYLGYSVRADEPTVNSKAADHVR